MKKISKPSCFLSRPIILIGNDIIGGPRWTNKAAEQSSPAHWHKRKTLILKVNACSGQKAIIVGLVQTQFDGFGGEKWKQMSKNPQNEACY